MLQPKFTPWPWGMLAIGAPLMAMVATVAQLLNDSHPSAQPDERLWRAAAVFFGVMGAGNGYLIAIAIGDLGRSVIALPLGATVGFYSVTALRLPYMAGALAVVFSILMFRSVIEGARMVLGCAACMLLAVLLMLIFAGAADENANALHALPLCYPLVCSIVTASMPLERTLEGVSGAFIVGARASVQSMVVALAAFSGVMLLFTIVDRLFWLNLGMTPLVCSAAIATAVANYRCIKSLFELVYRVDPEAERDFESPAPETIAARNAQNADVETKPASAVQAGTEKLQ